MSAHRVLPSRTEVPVPPPLYYVAGLAVGGLLHAVVPLAAPDRGVAGLIGVVSAFIGVLFIGTAVAELRRGDGLVEDGPFEFTRNPIYVGLAFVYFGVAAAMQLTWAVLLLPFVVFAVDKLVVAREERYLLSIYGDEYRHYLAATPRWLVAKWRAR